MGKYIVYPWQLRSMRDEISDIMEEAFDPSFRWAGDKFPLWQPPVDAYETEDNFIIEMELPGVNRNLVHVETRDGFLMVYGERRKEKNVVAGAYQIMERTYGPFARRFSLPQDVDQEKITACFKTGILRVTVPKKRKSSSRIQIKINES
ncbi:MAG: Hsp20/alpha crystallin family protein [Thermodesulfobacteriota bacterium]